MEQSVANDQEAAARDFGDVRAEFGALISGCGLYALSERAKIALKGSDRARWLNGMITNNIRDLPAGRGVYGFVLNPQGHILGDLYAYNRGDSLLVDTGQEQSAKLLELFERYIIMDDVEVADVSGRFAALGIAGPRSREVLRALGFDVPDLEALQFSDIAWREVPATLVRGEWLKQESYEIWVGPENAGRVRDALKQSGATQVGTAAFELYRVALGIPRYGVDIRERDLPQETGQGRALNFTKGCYVGQEIVERIRSRGSVRRLFKGFVANGPLPAPGSKIQSEGKEVGEVTSSACLPLKNGELRVSLGYVRREAAEKPLQAAGAALVASETPFPGVS